MKTEKLKCSVQGCERRADVEVILVDVYAEGFAFFAQDFTCPYLCNHHMMENERLAIGERRPRGHVKYRYTNQDDASGFNVYRPID